MAIVQISQITNRKGLQIDLPQLAGAELGWSIDERRLFIGNGTLEEGAPVIGNTEILTEFSDILNFNTTYAYKGLAAGYQAQTGPLPGVPITQSLQSWLDQFATVKDFGAVGDGVTDDTDAINRALQQLYCVEPYTTPTNAAARRSLFFPAGIYKITSSIKIPPYATLYGEGVENTIIRMEASDDSALNEYVARTADNLQQVGSAIGTGAATTAPENISISNLTFQNLDETTNIFGLESATNCRFQNVNFQGPMTTSNLTSDANGTNCVVMANTGSYVTKDIVFNACQFSGCVWAFNTDDQIKSVTVSNSLFDTLYQGIVVGTSAPVVDSATGFRITGNLFDNIYAEGVVWGSYTTLNATGHNIFYDVGNNFAGEGNPATSVIDIQSNNNVSIGDLFERSNANSANIVRINLNATTSIATTNGSRIELGMYTRLSGLVAGLVDDTSTPTTLFTVNANNVNAFCFDYVILRDTAYRNGKVTVATDSGSSDLTYTDDYVENISTGISLSITQTGNTVSVKYTSTNTGINGVMIYSITHLI